MLKIFLFTFSLFVFQSSFSQNKDVEILKKMNSDLINAALTTDTALVSGIFAADMELINPAGIKMNRQDLLKNAATYPALAVHIDSADVRMITKDVGIVTGYLTFTVPSGSEKYTGRNCYQDIYVKRNNRWYEVAAHVTLLK